MVLALSGFTQKAAELYKPAQSLESSQLMHELHIAPEHFAIHLERYAASVIVGVTYGRRVRDIGADIVVQENKRSMEVLTHVNIPGKYLVESLPFLKHTPEWLAPWKKLAREQRERDVAYLTGLVAEVKDKMARGVAPNSFAKQLLEANPEARVIAGARAPEKADALQALVQASGGRAAVITLDLVSLQLWCL